MSLTVSTYQRIEHTRTPIPGAPPAKAAGPERWRTTVWSSSAVTELAETVRRPRPSRLILPSLATQDVLVEGEELDQLEREVDALLANAADVVRKIRLTAPMIGLIIDESGPHTPSESELVEGFRARLLYMKEAIQFAKTVPHGVVEIS